MRPSYEFLTSELLDQLVTEATAHGDQHMFPLMKFFRIILGDKTAPRQPAYREELKIAHQRLASATTPGKAAEIQRLARRAEREEARRIRQESRAVIKRGRGRPKSV